MLCLLVGGRDESNDESKIRRALHREAGALPRFHPYLFAHVRTAARRSRHSAPFPRQSAVSPPSVHQMIVTLERNGFIRRQPGVPRSIEILVPTESLPILEWLRIKPSKSL